MASIDVMQTTDGPGAPGQARAPRRKRRGRPTRRNRRLVPRRLLTNWGEARARRRMLALRRELAAASNPRRRLVGHEGEGPSLDEHALQQRSVALAAELNRIEWLLEQHHRGGAATGRVVGPGTAVELVDAATGEPAEYRIAACASPTDSNVVDVGSLVGQALLGRSEGSMATIATPQGLQRVRVVSVEPLEEE